MPAPPEPPPDYRQQLATIRDERGYTLSYHEIYARTEPAFLEAYARLYRRFALDQRYLSPRERELIWVGLLATDEENVGTLHVERGYDAGLSADEMAEAVAVAGAAAAWRPLFFAHRAWGHTLPLDHLSRYDALLEVAAPHLSAQEVQLIALLTHGVREEEDAFLHHLGRLYADGIDERCLAEAVSYLLLPCGANTLLWATDLWLSAIESGRITPTGALMDVNTRTRRS